MSYTIGDTSIVSEFINVVLGISGDTFTKDTESGVMKWQNSYGNVYTQEKMTGSVNMAVNGIVDIYTLPAMCEIDLDTDNVSAIATAQYVLGVSSDTGNLSVTGFMDDETRDAIKQYQISNNLFEFGFTVPISYFYNTDDDLQIAFTQAQTGETSSLGITFNPGDFFLSLSTQNLYQCVSANGSLSLVDLGVKPSEYYGACPTGIVNIPTWNSFRDRFGAYGL